MVMKILYFFFPRSFIILAFKLKAMSMIHFKLVFVYKIGVKVWFFSYGYSIVSASFVETMAIPHLNYLDIFFENQ